MAAHVAIAWLILRLFGAAYAAAATGVENLRILALLHRHRADRKDHT